mgnify:CR=1 FL=1
MRIILATNTSKTTVKKSGGKYIVSGIPITVDNAVMNDILYSANENAKGMKTLNGMPLALTHPADSDGRNVSIFSPEGIDFYSGGKVTNTYNKNGVWYADSEIDEKRLQATDQGEYFANRLDQGLPIGVSTGLSFEVNNNAGCGYKMEAINQSYDHLAMLHDSERPAGGDATVMRFNGEDVQVVNVSDIEQATKPVGPPNEVLNESSFNRLLDLLKSAFAQNKDKSYNSLEIDKNQQNEESTMLDEKIEAKLKAANIKMEGLDADAKLAAYNTLITDERKPSINSEETPAWAKDLVEKVQSLESSIAANAEAELEAVADKVEALKMGINKDVAKSMGLEAAKSFLAANSAEYVADYQAPQGRSSVKNAELLDSNMPD